MYCTVIHSDEYVELEVSLQCSSHFVSRRELIGGIVRTEIDGIIDLVLYRRM